MKKIFIYLLIIMMATSLLITGCSWEQKNSIQNEHSEQPQGSKNTELVVLYYGDENNEEFVTEEHQISYYEESDKYKVALEELIKGPNNERYQSNIKKETQVYGTMKKNDKLVVNLSEEFNQFAGSIAEVIAVGSVVNTMTQFEEINQVKILINNRELRGPSGEPRGFMETFATNEGETKIVLYFANKDATKVTKEVRVITNELLNEEELAIKAIEELIKGPNNSNLHRTIPEEVTMLSLKVKKNIAYVDFSKEMHTKHWGGATGEAMTIYSIVNTLTEFDHIELVKMTVEGKPMAIEHAILEEPISRNEEMIE